jgi:hypothetical protein
MDRVRRHAGRALRRSARRRDRHRAPFGGPDLGGLASVELDRLAARRRCKIPRAGTVNSGTGCRLVDDLDAAVWIFDEGGVAIHLGPDVSVAEAMAQPGHGGPYNMML